MDVLQSEGSYRSDQMKQPRAQQNTIAASGAGAGLPFLFLSSSRHLIVHHARDAQPHPSIPTPSQLSPSFPSRLHQRNGLVSLVAPAGLTSISEVYRSPSAQRDFVSALSSQYQTRTLEQQSPD